MGNSSETLPIRQDVPEDLAPGLRFASWKGVGNEEAGKTTLRRRKEAGTGGWIGECAMRRSLWACYIACIRGRVLCLNEAEGWAKK